MKTGNGTRDMGFGTRDTGFRIRNSESGIREAGKGKSKGKVQKADFRNKCHSDGNHGVPVPQFRDDCL